VAPGGEERDNNGFAIVRKFGSINGLAIDVLELERRNLCLKGCKANEKHGNSSGKELFHFFYLLKVIIFNNMNQKWPFSLIFGANILIFLLLLVDCMKNSLYLHKNLINYHKNTLNYAKKSFILASSASTHCL
jgi:hypothetical protein